MRYHAHREKERHRRRRRRTQTKKTHACDQKIRCLHSIILTKQVLASGTGRYHYWPSQQCSKRQYQASPATKVPAAQRRSLISSWFQLPKLSGYFDLRTVEYSYVRRIFFSSEIARTLTLSGQVDRSPSVAGIDASSSHSRTSPHLGYRSQGGSRTSRSPSSLIYHFRISPKHILILWHRTVRPKHILILWHRTTYLLQITTRHILCSFFPLRL